MDFLIEQKREAISFCGEILMSDFERLRLSAYDRALLVDIDGNTKATPADYLLGLETIFRRQAEAEQKGL